MFLRRYTRTKNGKTHTCYALVESVRTEAGPRQHVVAHLGELNHDQQRRWQRTIVFHNRQGNAQQLRIFPNDEHVSVNLPGTASVVRSWLAEEATPFGSEARLDSVRTPWGLRRSPGTFYDSAGVLQVFRDMSCRRHFPHERPHVGELRTPLTDGFRAFLATLAVCGGPCLALRRSWPCREAPGLVGQRSGADPLSPLRRKAHSFPGVSLACCDSPRVLRRRRRRFSRHPQPASLLTSSLLG